MDGDAVIRGLQHLRIRTQQRLLQALALVLPFPRSTLLIGAGSSQRLAAELQRRGWAGRC